MSDQKAEPRPGQDKHVDKAKEKTRQGHEDRSLKDKERSGPSREHNG